MIRVIHISDLHLDSQKPPLEKRQIIDALAQDLKRHVNESTILAFTGDLIHCGGKFFGKHQENAFKFFDQLFVKPILAQNPTLKNRIFIVPGNHDVNRDKIDPISEEGLKSSLLSQTAVTEFIKNNKKKSIHLERLSEYKKWESSFYKSYSNATLSLFENSFRLKIGSLTVGIACLNSAWLCKGNSDRGNLIVGKSQLDSANEKLKNCQIRLALAHHPLEFLNDFDKDDVKVELFKYYDILFTGHVHELASSYTQDLYGNIFISIANSTIADNPPDRKSVNGYTVLDLYPNEKIITHYRRYVEAHKKFVPNTEIGSEDGSKEWPILKDETLTKFLEVADIVNSLSQKHIEKLNGDLIVTSSATNAPCSIDSLFVEPTILNTPQDLREERDVVTYTVEKILSRNSNFLIYGPKESGKTILMDKLFLEAVKKFNQLSKIPILIRFNELTDEIEESIKDFLGKSRAAVRQLLSNNDSILFLDNISFLESEPKKIQNLKDFIKEYPRVQIIASSELLSETNIPTEYLDHNESLQFEIGFIQNLNSHQIKELIGKWFIGKEVDFRENMEKLMKHFGDFGLPKTPLSVTMFLWIYERQEKRPLNNSVLVEMFIENLLEKTSIENIYSETFDFKNKQRFLSFISKFMRDNGDENTSYSVDYIKLLSFANDYLKTRFPGKPQKVIDDLIKRGVLCYSHNNSVRFKSAFFFHYFLALQIDYDPAFRSHILEGDNYLYYAEEIVYYTGLKRDDVSFLNFTQEKLNEALGDFNNDVEQNFEKVDQTLEAKAKSDTLTSKIDTKSIEEKPSESALEEMYDEQLSNIPVKRDVPKRFGTSLSTKKNVDKVLKLAANVLKNSEDVDDFNLKTDAYRRTLISAISCMIRERDTFILLLREFKKGNGKLPKNIDLRVFIQIIPLIYQVVLYNWLGSQKLRPVLLKKIEEDKESLNISEFEKYMSVFIYSDIRGSDYPEIIEAFVKSIKFNYTKDLSFLKIISYYYLRNNAKTLDEKYIKLLTGIKEDLGHLGKTEKSQFRRNIEAKKRKETE